MDLADKLPDDDFKLHASLKRTLKGREDMIKSGKAMDWGTAEALAFGTLLAEGYNVRLSGQDCERRYLQLSSLCRARSEARSKTGFSMTSNLVNENAGTFHVANSFLSEYGVMGFELGYSMESPDNLVMWEAQFGDFVNGAQIIIDQYLASMESKWLRQTGLHVVVDFSPTIHTEKILTLKLKQQVLFLPRISRYGTRTQ